MAAIALARDEFNTTHRPKILIREMSLIPPTETEPTKVTFSVSNAGETDAIISSSELAARKLSSGKVCYIRTGDETDELHGLLMSAGQFIPWVNFIDIDIHQFKSFENNFHLRVDKSIEFYIQILVEGKIIYSDRGGVQRVSAFSRKYNFGTGQFGIGDSEREYAD
jgi:hypothetical protein